MLQGVTGSPPSTGRWKEVKAGRGLTISRIMELGGVSRSGLCRFDGEAAEVRIRM